MATSSTSLELRLTLFVERANALAPIFSGYHAVICLDLEHHAALQVHVQPIIDRLFDLSRRYRCVVGDAGSSLQRFREQCVGLADAVHHTPIERLLRGERLPGKQDLLGPTRPHRAWQVLCSTRSR